MEIFGLIVLILYFLPTLCARKHHNRDAIFALNLLLGWTLLGWIAALIWACTKPPPTRAPAGVDSPEGVRGRSLQASAGRPLLKSRPADAYIDPLVARFRYWPHFLILATLIGALAPMIYFNKTDPAQDISESTLSDASAEETGTLRRVGDGVVTAIPRAAPTAELKVTPPERTHSQPRQSAATVDDSELLWVTSDRLNRRTCPDLRCGIVGMFFFREGTERLEERNGWARVSRYYDAYCVDGVSRYVDSGNAACVSSNGIVGGKFAEWVSMQHLSRTRPADPAAGATGDYALIRSSDDYAQ